MIGLLLAAIIDTSRDDWSSYAHDSQRTGFQRQTTGITPATVHSLALRWRTKTASAGYPSPLVVGGSVYLTGSYGLITALNAQDGSTRWTHLLPGNFASRPIIATPALSNGVLYVAEHFKAPEPSYLTALRASDGVQLWRVAMPGPAHGAPIVYNGLVTVGFSQSDDDWGQLVIQGGIQAYRIADGSRAWTWHVDSSRTDNGGGVWANCALSARNLYCGTSNTFRVPVETAETVVSLDAPTGRYTGRGVLGWGPQDDDFGGGDMVSGNTLFAQGKSGTLWAFPLSSGATQWHTPLGAANEQGGIATPTTDGATIVVSGGYYPAPALGRLFGLDRATGHVRWTVPMPVALRDYVALVPGVAFGSSGTTTAALSLATGKRLWSYTTLGPIRNGPVVVPSGYYVSDSAGYVYAFR